jgi:hypothetical protein
MTKPASKTRHPLRRRRLALLASVALAALTAGCGDDDDAGDDDDDNDPEQLIEDIEDLAEGAGARGLAEGLRLSLLTEDEEDRRTVSAIRDAADRLPGEPEVAGIEDGDGDQRDDDGTIEVRVEDEAACVSISGDGSVDVTGERC